ncbi:phosphonate C-P lyase system protein PhnH [Ancylobacter sp. G4_0304]|uniref:phosphonate C-P lyase system protein PhnH n=1 Tax=Ancylobacter sp. G4_0304 TaxID=3114289 RepID=UPI0039C65C22
MAGLALGFVDPVFDSQGVFRAAMWALARPGRPEPLAVTLDPPAPLSPEAAALLLALCDFETPIWLDAPAASAPQVAHFLRFHTGARIVADPAGARFALITDPARMPDFVGFAQGTLEYPDASATLVVQVNGFASSGLVLEGPGVKGARGFGADPLPVDFSARLAANRAGFPLGVDLLLVGAGHVAGLPRSVMVREG